MSRWHREHPDYLETGMQPPDPRDAWDMERKRQKEEPTEEDIKKLLGPESYAMYRRKMDQLRRGE